MRNIKGHNDQLQYSRELQNIVRGIVHDIRYQGLEPNFSNLEKVRSYDTTFISKSLDVLRIFDEQVFKGQHFISSQNIASFLAKLVYQINPETILDPACGTCSYFVAINSLKPNIKFCGIDKNQDILCAAKEFMRDININCELENADFLEFSNEIDEKFDLIVSQPPFGILRDIQIENINNINVRRIEINFLLRN